MSDRQSPANGSARIEGARTAIGSALRARANLVPNMHHEMPSKRFIEWATYFSDLDWAALTSAYVGERVRIADGNVRAAADGTGDDVGQRLHQYGAAIELEPRRVSLRIAALLWMASKAQTQNRATLEAFSPSLVA